MSRWQLALALTCFVGNPAAGQSTIPATVPVHADDFESGSLEDWFLSGTGTLDLAPGDGVGGSTAMAVTVTVDEAHLLRGNRREVARADEAYLTFWFDPNGVDLDDPGSGFIPNRSVQIAVIRGRDDGVMVALRFREVVPGSYEAFLQWIDGSGSQQYDFAEGSFPLDDGWQEVTIGFREDDWVACWLDGNEARSITGVTHLDPYAAKVEIGKTNSPPLLASPSGEMRFDEVSFEIPEVSDLWVDAAGGDDAADGRTPGTAFATVARASDLATAGTVVHIQPGIYREAVVPAQGGLPGDPAVYRAEAGPGTVRIRGTAPSSELTWTQLESDTIGLPPGVDSGEIWWTDLSSWELEERPDFLVRTGPGGLVEERLLPAREPDWQVAVPHRHSDFWWVANGGSSIAGCDPSSHPDNDCDLPSRSSLQLTDTVGETSPPGIEDGDLTTLGSLVGATLVAREAYWGHRLFVRRIVAHDVGAGRVTIDLAADDSDGDPGLGWGTQYYVESHPGLIDEPGEWWFDEVSGRLYLWPPTPGDPAGQSLEVARHDHAFDLTDRSHARLEELDLELFNEALIEVRNLNWLAARGLEIVRCGLRWGERGLLLSQTVVAGEHADKVIEGILIEDNVFSSIDHDAIRVTSNWDDGNHPDSWVRPATTDIEIRANTFSDIGFRPPQGTVGAAGALWIWWGDRVTVEGNHFHSTAQEGIKIFRSVVQSPNEWGFSPSEIKTGRILVRDNLVEQACRLKNDCGAILVEGPAPDEHVFRELLVTGNTLREVVGWSWAAEQRGLWKSSPLAGGGGIGLYLNGSGLHAYRNIFYSNAFAGVHLTGRWRDGELYFYNNTSTDNAFGIHFGGTTEDTHDDYDTQVQANLIVNNSAHGIKVSNLESTYPNVLVDRDLYFANGWNETLPEPGVFKIDHGASAEYFPTIEELRAGTPFEDAGQEADPTFLDYDAGDRSLLDGSRPDFRLLDGSPAVDAGPAALPAALDGLLSLFGIVDPPEGPAYDQGALEGTIACNDLTVVEEIVESAVTYQTCGFLTLGPDVVVRSPGSLTAIAGYAIVLTNDVRIEAGGTLEATTGIFPP